MSRGRRVLYISHTGLVEPLGRHQVVPYVVELAALGHEITVLSYAPSVEGVEEEADAREVERTLATRGVRWIALRRRPGHSLLSKVADLLRGLSLAARECRASRVEIVHARSHLPAAIGLLLKLVFRSKLIFDVRGLVADEYADVGHWRRGGLEYSLTNAAQRALLGHSDAIVVLTERIRRDLPSLGARPGAAVRVVPCCVDIERFKLDPEARSSVRRELGLEGRTVLVYSGTLGSWYLDDEMLRLAVAARGVIPDLALLVLTRSNTEDLVRRARASGLRPGVDLFVRSVRPSDMPRFLNAGDAAVSFVRPSPSKKASSPTKHGEYLASGLPIVINSGVGDNDGLAGHRAFVVVRDFSREALEHAARELVDRGVGGAALRETCRETAAALLGLRTLGAGRYGDLYALL